MGSPGEAAIAVWDDIAAQYEAAHPGWKVEMNYPNDDLYEQIGLKNLLADRNPPDIYFEWTGSRMAAALRRRLRGRYHRGGALRPPGRPVR